MLAKAEANSPTPGTFGFLAPELSFLPPAAMSREGENCVVLGVKLEPFSWVNF